VNLCIDVLRALPCPTVLVPGNNESLEQLHAACLGWQGVHVVHGSGVTLQGIPFFGLGGGVPVTPFGAWSYDFTEAEAAEHLRDFPFGGVLVSHSPPLGILDRASNGKHLGSATVRQLVTTHEPALVVCGHIHACWARRETVGHTLVVNAGPAGVLVELPSDK
jgi:Icc-related predicted phosphoesterase